MGYPILMRAMVLESPGAIRSDGTGGPLRAITRDDDQPGEGQLAICVAACGVCRTELQRCEGDLEARSLPVVPGHQIVGRVEAIGPGVTGWRVGDRAGVGWLARACGECTECARGRENLCERARFTGWDGDG